jgi:hypothetical protein
VKTACPNCGAEIEFRYDDSFVRICSHCRNAVERTDRGLDTLGKVADLVPIDSPLKLFAEGHLGSMGFLLVGMAQIRHAAGGLWQEWYAKLDGGRWGWLAEAQGRYYLTFEEAAGELPAFEALAAGQVVSLPVRGAARAFTVSEHTSAQYVAANGELPYRLVPQGSFRYVDLDDGVGTFATIDYGEPGDTPALYIGQQTTLAELGITGGEVGPSRDAKISSARLACPNCNAPIELRAPDQSQRVVCSYCNHLIALDGTLQVLAKLAKKAQPSIPLGSTGKFLDGEMTVIGYLERAAEIDDTWYSFDEYLLHSPEIGFRWLVCSDGHWSYVQPVSTGAVDNTGLGATYDGVKFRSFTSAPLRVQLVLGELYWQVTEGEMVQSQDFIAPPAMLSLESTESEVTWSLSTYMTEHEVLHAFGAAQLSLPPAMRKAPNQVNRAERVTAHMALGALLLIALGIGFSIAAPNKLVYEHSVPIGGAAPAPAPAPVADICTRMQAALAAVAACPAVPQVSRDAFATYTSGTPSPDQCQQGFDAANAVLDANSCPKPADAAAAETTSVFFSDPFQLEARRNVELHFSTMVDNDWVYVTADLVNQNTGDVVEVEAAMEHWSGVEDGESWAEGKRDNTAIIGPPPAGTYLLRVEGQRGLTGETMVQVAVHQGVFRGYYLWWALFILCVPLAGFALYAKAFEKTRWEDSARGTPPGSLTSGFALLLCGLIVAYGVYMIYARFTS